MTDYTELISDLRDADQASWKRLSLDAAAAIEALQAEIRESMQKCAECGENEPKRGEWIRVEDGESYHYECSKCGERPLYSRYGDVVLGGVCPMCGAKMEVQE